MTDLPIIVPDQDLILEAAVDKNSPAVSDISSQTVLAGEMVKPSLSSLFQASVKSTEIVQPETPEPLVPEKETPSETIAAKGILDSIVSPIQNFITNISKSTSNFFGSNSKLVSESEKIVSSGFAEVLSSSEKIYSQSLDSNLKQTSNLIETATSSVKEITDKAVLEKEMVKDSLDKATNLIKSAEISTSSILSKSIIGGENKKEDDVASAFSGSDNKLLALFKEKEAAVNSGSTTNTTNNSNASSVSVKSSKLIESSEVKNLITPDKTLEKSVTMLSRTLPEAVNNLSTSVTSISPSTVSSTSNFTEGAKIDQSSSTVINKGSESYPAVETSDRAKAEADKSNQMNEYYLQAIYSALMSGKIKVKLETY